MKKHSDRLYGRIRRIYRLLTALGLACCYIAGPLAVARAAENINAGNPPSIGQMRAAGPMKDLDEIVFCTRSGYDDGHWYANIGYYCDDDSLKAYAGNGKSDDGKLIKLNIRTGKITILLDAQGGSVRDPQVHYDAQKILFSYRKTGSDYYNLYEINIDGSNLRQITSGEFDDYEPIYLPDGGIAFVSTRCNRWVNCWMTQVGVLYRCDADGTNIRLISANTEHDNTPWVLPDGRIIYTRWEYVDRSQVEFHHLWTMNPDGTGQTIFYGNMHPHIVMIDAKPIPGADKVVASFSPGHGANEHAGIATVVSDKHGPDDLSAARPLHRGKLIRDPYPLSEDCFLVAQDNKILVLDGNGRFEPLYVYSGQGSPHEPRPIIPRNREQIIPQRVDYAKQTGQFILADVYSGRNMDGVKLGSIKRLLILESLPKPVNFSGGPDLVSWLGTFTLERVLGTVPVEKDGSAYFEAPANRQVFFVALDQDDMSVKRMQSFTCVMPGEVISCVGCHENRTSTSANKPTPVMLALQRPPSRIEPFEGFPDVMDFARDVQPILDRHCVSCHDWQKREGGVVLTGDLGPNWSHSFFSLFAHSQVVDGRNGLGNQPPRSIGSSASPLLGKTDGSHYGAKLDLRERQMLWLWIESGAPYAGTYAALRNGKAQIDAAAATIEVFGKQAGVIRRRCGDCHDVGHTDINSKLPLPFDYEARRKNRTIAQRPTAVYERIVIANDPIARFSPNILLNFSRPDLSLLLLGPLAIEAGGYESCGKVFNNADDPDFKLLLAAIQKGKTMIESEPRFSTPGFKPNPQYVRELKKFGILPASFDLSENDLNVYDADQRYWKSFW